jgi:uncharacterized protein
MICPVCNSEMIIQELHQVEVDHCLGCHGIWLDQGELEMLLAGDDQQDPLIASFKVAVTHEKPRKCPICKNQMEKLHAGDDRNLVMIDQCSKKHGIWFDAGELHHLLESSETPETKIISLLKEMFPL